MVGAERFTRTANPDENIFATDTQLHIPLHFTQPDCICGD